MPRVALTANTLWLIERMFPSELCASVVALLEAECGSGLPIMGEATPEGLERVRFAVLKLSKGSTTELAREVALAKIDWRDVLVAADFATDVHAHQVWLREQIRV